MSTPFELAVSALRNVPYEGKAVALANGAAIAREQSDLVVVTESWNAGAKEAIAHSNPALTFWTYPDQSVMLGHNPKRFSVITHGRILGGASPAIKGLCDRRDLVFEVLHDKAQHRVVILMGIHTAPIRPSLGTGMVLKARASHVAARARVRTFMRNHRAPLILGGDFNERHLVRVLGVAGGQVGNGIVHAEIEDRLVCTHSEGFSLRSDHEGVVMTLKQRV